MGENAEAGYNTLSPSRIKGKGGFTATSFIYVLTALENMGVVANMVSLVLYFSYKMYFDLSSSANTLTNLMGSLYLLTLVGGFISDTYLNRFLTCLIFGTLEVLIVGQLYWNSTYCPNLKKKTLEGSFGGTTFIGFYPFLGVCVACGFNYTAKSIALSMMTIQAHSERLLPKPCGKPSCVKGGVAVYFYTTLCLLALGAGGVKGSLPPLGADQFDAKSPKEAKGLASYFNWLLLSSVIGSSVGVTVVVWVATNKNNHNWWKGFLITAIGAFVGYVFLVVGKPFYRLHVPKDSPLTRIAQVIVVAVKNGKLSHPESPSELYEINEKDAESTKLAHTPQFRWLDKAAILPHNTTPSPWKVCTVTQVEEVKLLTRMLPIVASTIILNTCLAQLQTFSVQQGYRMDPYLGSFQVPAASIPVIPLLFMIILIPIYDRLFVPFVRKFTKHPSGITQLQRVGVGLVLSALSMAVAALVEVKRREQSLKNPLKPISLFWLAFQFGIFGIADMFTLVGLLEFFYKEAPTGMRSLSTALTWISQSFGYFLSSVFVDAINSVTKRVSPSRQGWLHGQDLDRNNLNLFYWFLAVLSVLNFFNYLFWAKRYKYKTDDDDDQNDSSAAATPEMPMLKAAAADNDGSVVSNGGSLVEETNGKY